MDPRPVEVSPVSAPALVRRGNDDKALAPGRPVVQVDGGGGIQRVEIASSARAHDVDLEIVRESQRVVRGPLRQVLRGRDRPSRSATGRVEFHVIERTRERIARVREGVIEEHLVPVRPRGRVEEEGEGERIPHREDRSERVVVGRAHLGSVRPVAHEGVRREGAGRSGEVPDVVEEGELVRERGVLHDVLRPELVGRVPEQGDVREDGVDLHRVGIGGPGVDGDPGEGGGREGSRNAGAREEGGDDRTGFVQEAEVGDTDRCRGRRVRRLDLLVANRAGRACVEVGEERVPERDPGRGEGAREASGGIREGAHTGGSGGCGPPRVARGDGGRSGGRRGPGGSARDPWAGTGKGSRHGRERGPARAREGPDGGGHDENGDEEGPGSPRRRAQHDPSQRARGSYALGRRRLRVGPEPNGAVAVLKSPRGPGFRPARVPASGRGIDKGEPPLPRSCRSACCAGSVTILPPRPGPARRSDDECGRPPEGPATRSSRAPASRASSCTRPRAVRGSRRRPGCSATRANARSPSCPKRPPRSPGSLWTGPSRSRSR